MLEKRKRDFVKLLQKFSRKYGLRQVVAAILCCACTVLALLCYGLFFADSATRAEATTVEYAIESQVSVWREFTLDYWLPAMLRNTMLGASCRLIIKPTAFLSDQRTVTLVWSMIGCKHAQDALTKVCFKNRHKHPPTTAFCCSASLRTTSARPYDSRTCIVHAVNMDPVTDHYLVEAKIGRGMMRGTLGSTWEGTVWKNESAVSNDARLLRGIKGLTLLNRFELTVPGEEWDINFKAVILGDSQSGAVAFDRLLRRIAGTTIPSMLVHLGDLVQDAHRTREWHSYFFGPVEYSSLNNRLPWLVVRGNHDLVNVKKAMAENKLMKGPVSHVSVDNRAAGVVHPALDRSFFSTTAGGIRWVVLDSNINSDEQTRFMLREFKSREFRNAHFRIVCTHAPPFLEYWDPKSWHDGESQWGLYVRQEWVPLFERFRVDLVMSGHSHIYQRGERNGIVYMVSGGAGAPLEEMRANHVQNYSMYTVTAQRHHYVELATLKGKNVAQQANPLGCQQSPSLRLQATDLGGNIFDTFSIRPKGCKR
jgi:predicted phosphodiesterase